MKRCEEFMKDFAPPSNYELGFKAGYDAAMSLKKTETVVVPTQIAKTEDIMWPDRLPTTIPFPPTMTTNRCDICGIEMKGDWGYVCYHPKCPTRVTC